MKTIQTITALPAIAAALVFSSCDNKEEIIVPDETAPTTESTTTPLTPPPTSPSTSPNTGSGPPAGTSTTDDDNTLKVPDSEITTPEDR